MSKLALQTRPASETIDPAARTTAELKPWFIHNFPCELRRRFMGYCRANGYTARELVALMVEKELEGTGH